jgi:hypothetical protein
LPWIICCRLLPGHPPAWVEIHRHNRTAAGNIGVNRIYIDDRSQCTGDVVYHPKYDDRFFENDVAIIILPTPVTDATPVVLNENEKIPKEGDMVDVSGWGTTYYGASKLSVFPQAVNVSYVTNDACTRKPYRYQESLINDASLCLAEEGKDSCQGDSGKPQTEGTICQSFNRFILI